jgi:hypothetical protein
VEPAFDINRGGQGGGPVRRPCSVAAYRWMPSTRSGTVAAESRMATSGRRYWHVAEVEGGRAGVASAQLSTRKAEGRVSSAAPLGLRARGSAARPSEERQQPPTKRACPLDGPGVVGMLTPAPTRRRWRGAVRFGGRLVGRTGGVAAAVRVANAQPPGLELVRCEGQERGHLPALLAALRCPGERTDVVIGVRGVEGPPRHAAPR